MKREFTTNWQPLFQLLQLLECLSGYMCGDNLTMKFPPDFHNYTGLNELVNSFPWFTIAPPNELILGCKPHWCAKMKKTTSCEKWLLEGFCKTAFLKIYQNSEKYLGKSLSNTAKSFHAVRFATFFKERPPHWFQSKPFVDPLKNRCSWIIYKIHRKALVFDSLFK